MFEPYLVHTGVLIIWKESSLSEMIDYSIASSSNKLDASDSDYASLLSSVVLFVLRRLSSDGNEIDIAIFFSRFN